MIACTYCGRENDETRKACSECGTELPSKAEDLARRAKERQAGETREAIRRQREHRRQAAQQAEFAELTRGQVPRKCRCGTALTIQRARQTRLGGLIPLFTVFRHHCPRCGREATVPSGVAIAYWLVAGSLLSLLVVAGFAAESGPDVRPDGSGRWFLAFPVLACAWLWGRALQGIWARRRYPRLSVPPVQ